MAKLNTGILMVTTQGPVVLGGEIGRAYENVFDQDPTSDTLRINMTHVDVQNTDGLHLGGNSNTLIPRCEGDGDARQTGNKCMHFLASSYKNQVPGGDATNVAQGITIDAPTGTGFNQISGFVCSNVPTGHCITDNSVDSQIYNQDTLYMRRKDSSVPTQGGLSAGLLNGFGGTTEFPIYLATSGYGAFLADSTSSTTGLMLNSDGGTTGKRGMDRFQ
jgi:hypothetical protein